MSQLEASRDNLTAGWKSTAQNWKATRQTWKDHQTEHFEQHQIEPLEQGLQHTLRALDQLIDAVNAARREL